MSELPTDDNKTVRPISSNRRLLVLAFLLLCIASVSVAYVLQQRRYASQLDRKNAELSASLNQTRSQLEALTEKLNAISTPPPPALAPAPPKPLRTTAHHRPAARALAVRRPAEDPRWNEIKGQLGEHQKQITATQQNLEKARAELAADLSSAKNQLGASIARNHEELVAFEKRGERNFYEFDLSKSKQFRHVGPVSISLRKSDTKRQYCDLRVLVEDVELTQKHVNLYEAVLLYPQGYSQGLELVINQIEKNEARGYVSAPKYKASDLAAGATDETPAASNDAASLQRRPVTEK